MSSGPSPAERDVHEEEQEAPIVRDRRRVDPETGAVREPAGDEATGAPYEGAPDGPPAPGGFDPGPGAGPAADSPGSAGAAEEPAAGEPTAGEAGSASSEMAELRQELGERTQDLQRLQAEYVNYKRRVDRDRESVRQLAVGEALSELLPVLDDIGRAREHGELQGGFKAVAESLEAALAKLGLEQYGEVGDPFDPRVHEALMHSYSDEVTEASCSAILQPGYGMGERVLRPARVAVAEPTTGLGDAEAAGAEGGADRGSVPPQESAPGVDAG